MLNILGGRKEKKEGFTMKKVIFLTLVITTMMLSVCFATPAEEKTFIQPDFLTAPSKYTISLRPVNQVYTITFNGIVVGADEILNGLENNKAW